FLILLLISIEVFSTPIRKFVVKDDMYYTRSFDFSLIDMLNVKHHKLNYTRFFQKIMKDRHEEIVKLMGNSKEIVRG
ncbi:hypothetical protein PENTCL1PPCAC_22997, partial [Pristionchus entomophagus]